MNTINAPHPTILGIKEIKSTQTLINTKDIIERTISIRSFLENHDETKSPTPTTKHKPANINIVMSKTPFSFFYFRYIDSFITTKNLIIKKLSIYNKEE